MSSAWLASGFAVFFWWISTGAILVAVRRADRQGSHLRLVLRALPLLGFGIVAVALSLPAATVWGVYLGFVGALAIWGWIELAFLAGVITGPVRSDCPPGLTGRARFMRAFGAVSYHELALVSGLWALVLAAESAENPVALATYLVLFLARILAKLNLFFGVPRINLEFIPARLQHLKTYFRQGPVTLAFPLAITLLTTLLVICAERLIFATAAPTLVGYALLTALSALALLEHWLMVLPLPDAKLWRWMLPAGAPLPPRMTKEER